MVLPSHQEPVQLPNRNWVAEQDVCCTLHANGVLAPATARAGELQATVSIDQAASGALQPPPLLVAPSGWTPSFPGTKHRPGYLPHPPQGTPLPAVPPATGRPPGCAPLPPPRLFPGSAVPPPWAEPLVPVSEDTRQEVADGEASRLTQPEGLLHRLVYDAWLPSSSPLPAVSSLAACVTAMQSHLSCHTPCRCLVLSSAWTHSNVGCTLPGGSAPQLPLTSSLHCLRVCMGSSAGCCSAGGRPCLCPRAACLVHP
jgi:hypothetical protein